MRDQGIRDSQPQLYVMRPPRALWGDYGDILLQGMADRAPDGVLLLRRTGPFIPPISFPWPTVVVTQAVRKRMEPERFTGFEFRLVSKRRIVHLDWRSWDLTAEEPAEHPETGEPEDYIDRGKHSAATARDMGELWEMFVPATPGLQIHGSSDFDPSRYGGQDICRQGEVGHTYVSRRLRDWLLLNYAEWVRFQPARATERG